MRFYCVAQGIIVVQYSVIIHNGKEYGKKCVYMYNSVTLMYSRN